MATEIYREDLGCICASAAFECYPARNAELKYRLFMLGTQELDNEDSILKLTTEPDLPDGNKDVLTFEDNNCFSTWNATTNIELIFWQLFIDNNLNDPVYTFGDDVTCVWGKPARRVQPASYKLHLIFFVDSTWAQDALLRNASAGKDMRFRFTKGAYYLEFACSSCQITKVNITHEEGEPSICVASLAAAKLDIFYGDGTT